MVIRTNVLTDLYVGVEMGRVEAYILYMATLLSGIVIFSLYQFPVTVF